MHEDNQAIIDLLKAIADRLDQPQESSRVVPYGKWWQHLLKGKLSMAFRSLFGWRMGARGSAQVLDNLGLAGIKVAKLELKEGDILAVKILGKRPCKAEIEHIKHYLGSILPVGVKVIVLDRGDIELATVSRCQPEK